MNDDFSNILLFKTNISTPGDKHVLQHVFDLHPHIEHWTVDLEDEDHVLRIISSKLKHLSIIDMVCLHGYKCTEFKD